MTSRSLTITFWALALVTFLYLATRPHLVTVWDSVAADGTLVHSSQSRVDCENDVISHNHTPSEVNVYGRVSCRGVVQFQWGW
jgi:hypothetical protein